MKKQKILLIVPAYNEEENILKVYKSIINYNKKNNTKYDVIVINDGSTDNTCNICKKNKIPVINLIYNLGIGGAVQTGYKYAYNNNYDIAVQFDGDGQHDIKYVKHIIDSIIKKDADMVIGSRFIDKNSSEFKSNRTRRIGISIISKIIKIKMKKSIYDTTSGFRAVNKTLIKKFVENYPVEYPEPISVVNVLNDGFIVKEIPVNMNKRQGGVSSIKKWKSLYYMINVVLSILIIKKVKKND